MDASLAGNSTGDILREATSTTSPGGAYGEASEATMLRAATVSTVHEDAFTAGRDAAIDLLAELGRAPDLVILFSSAKYDAARVLEGVHSRLPAAVPLVGCSAYAEVDAEQALTSSVVAMGLVLEGIEVRTFHVVVKALVDLRLDLSSIATEQNLEEALRRCGVGRQSQGG
jgi:small ligand-binding sensory domain FIST